MVKNDLSAREKKGCGTAKPLIIAHRGASALAPENTLAAFERAMDDGAEGIEFDVRLAKDGVPVVIHDATLNRTGLIDRHVSEFTAAELGRIDVGSWFNASYPDRSNPDFNTQNVPNLAETLEFLKDFSGLLYIELKCEDAETIELVRAVCEKVSGSSLLPRIIVKSFDLGAISEMRTLCPSVKTAALFTLNIMTILRKEKHLINIADELGADELSIHYSLATRKLMEKAGRRGLPVTIWTVNNPRWVKRGVRLGLNAIITNNPKKLLEKRKEFISKV